MQDQRRPAGRTALPAIPARSARQCLAVEGRAARSSLVVRRVVGLDLNRFLAVAVHPDAQPGPAAEQFIARLTSEEAE